MASFYRFFLTIVALSLAAAVFLINKQILLIPHIHSSLQGMPDYISYAIYFAVCFLLAWISLKMAEYLANDVFRSGSVKQIEQANDAFLPSYLGYFFVALSVQSVSIFFIVFGIIVILIFFSRAAYFNPLYFLFGYRFYYATTNKDVKILIITQKKLKTPENVAFDRIKRINDFTFIDLEGNR